MTEIARKGDSGDAIDYMKGCWGKGGKDGKNTSDKGGDKEKGGKFAKGGKQGKCTDGKTSRKTPYFEI